MYEAGKRIFYFRAGPYDFACATCHGEAGKRIRLQDLPDLTKNPGDRDGFAAWPAYRVSNGQLWSMQRRLNDCYRQQRFPAPGYASDATDRAQRLHGRQQPRRAFDRAFDQALEDEPMKKRRMALARRDRAGRLRQHAVVAGPRPARARDASRARSTPRASPSSTASSRTRCRRPARRRRRRRPSSRASSRPRNWRRVQWPKDGVYLGDWKAGEKLAQDGRGMTWSDEAGKPGGGNCYNCHQMTKAEISFGTLGPSLYHYGEAARRHRSVRAGGGAGGSVHLGQAVERQGLQRLLGDAALRP